MKKVLDTYSSKNDVNIKQIVAYKDNILEVEEYKDGFTKEDTMNIMSVTKSVTSLLVGIAIDQGLIKSVDDFVMDYYKKIYTPKRGEQTIFRITIKHLLTMTAPYKGKSEPWTKVCTSKDWTLTTLDVLGGRKGITNEFRYHTLGVQILLGIIGITSGMNVLDFANEYLFKPLGIEPRSNAGCESKEDQFEYLMNKNDHGKVWFLDPTGMPTAGWGLSLSAYEMAQIGLMVLNNGAYNNARVVSKNWIEMMTKSYISTDEKFGNQDYGFLWWLPHRTSEVIAAIGDGGNVIYIDRKNQIVVAITAHFKPMVFDRVEYIEKILWKHYVLHCLRKDKDFVPELDFVMEKDGRIIGQNIFVKAVICADDGRQIPIMTMGPICIANDLKRKGYGKILLDYSIEKAKEMGAGALCFEGNIDFYGKSGFTYASEYGIRYHGLPEGEDAPSEMKFEFGEENMR